MRHAFPLVLGLSALIAAAAAASCSSTKFIPKGLPGVGGDDGSTSGNGSGIGVGSTTAQGAGGSVPATQCLDGINCASNSDCPNGYHCNEAVSPPQCAKLYCGTQGTLCSEDNDCEVGLLCLNKSCFSVCRLEGMSCGGTAECCAAFNCVDGVCVNPGSASSSASSTTSTTATTSTTSTTSSTGSGSCSTCADLITGMSVDPPCPGPAADAYQALGNCICDPSVCANDCVQTCTGQGADDANCIQCENTSIGGACATEFNDCAAN